MTWVLDNRPLGSILVSRLRYLGDVVMSTVVLEALKAGDPNLFLGYLCETAHGEALAGEVVIDRLHLLGVERSGADARARRASTSVNEQVSPAGKEQGTWGMVREIRRQGYDLAVDLFFNPRSAWLLRLGGIGARIGGTTGSRRRLYTHTVVASDVKRAAPDLNRWAPGALGDHVARLAPLRHAESGLDFMAWLEGYLEGRQLQPRLTAGTANDVLPYILLAPGATWPSKAWPRESWRELVEKLVAEDEVAVRILVPPGREDEFFDLASGFAESQVTVLPPAGLTGVKERLSAARAVITVDGGVMHMAVALGCPTIALFGPTDPAIWFPYESMGPFRVLTTAPHCHPCDLHHCDAFICLPDLTVQRVLETARELIKRPTAVAVDE